MISVYHATIFVISLAVLKNTLKKNNILSYGQNHYANNPNMPSIHAEHDAINKLPFSRKIQEVNILVVRFSDKKLSMSKPCQKCVRMMYEVFPKKGYIIKKIYYSDQNGNITKTKLDKLV